MKRADRDSLNLFKFSPSATRSCTRVLLSTVDSLYWEVRTRDISQAFVSSEYDLLSEVLIVPPKEVHRPKDELWRLLKPLYGLPESILLLYATYVGHICSIVTMACDLVNPCLFYILSSDNRVPASGVLAMQVDDTLFTGTSSYLANEKVNAHRFPTKPYSADSTNTVHFNGTFLSNTAPGFHASQT